MSKGYTTAADVVSQLGRTISGPQTAYLTNNVIPAAEEWVDRTAGRTYGEQPVIGERLIFAGSPYLWLTKTPLTSLDEIRGYLWNQTIDDLDVVPVSSYVLTNPAIGEIRLPNYASYAYLEADYTPVNTIPNSVKLATAMVCCAFMRTVLHPQSEWLTEYSSAQDLRLKMRDVAIPELVYTLLGTSAEGFSTIIVA